MELADQRDDKPAEADTVGDGNMNSPILTNWGQHQTVDGLLAHWARERPEALALSDPANKQEMGLSSAQHFDFRHADVLTNRIATHFLGLGLKPGDVVAMQLPNTIEQALLMLGLMRAGLVACPLPMLWRKSELDVALELVRPRALVSMSVFRGVDHADLMRHMAVDHVNIRFVLALGGAVPDGVMPASKLFAEEGDTEDTPPATDLAEKSIHDVACISWGTSADGTAYPIPRTHANLLTAGLMSVLEVGLSENDVLLNPYPLTTSAGLLGLYMPWLLSGAHLVQHHPFDYGTFSAQLAEAGVTYVLAPPSVAAAVIEKGRYGKSAWKLRSMGCVWPALHHAPVFDAEEPPGLNLYDVKTIMDLGLAVHRRQDFNTPVAVPLGQNRFPSHKSSGVALLETRLKGSLRKSEALDREPALMGKLFVRGPAMPNLPNEKDSAQDQEEADLALDTHPCTRYMASPAHS